MLNRLCPHLVTPASFIYPLEHRIWERFYVGAGIFLYDVLARLGSNPLPWHSHLGKTGLRRLSPALEARGGVRYWDTIVDDARHTVTLARTAAAHGALLANSARVVGLESEQGRIVAARILDLETGHELRVATRAVINATGVWTDEVEALSGERGMDVHASKGVHVLIPRDRIDSEAGLILRTEASVLFVIPWGEHWIVGTTDTPWSLRRAHRAASRSDIDYIITRINASLTKPISATDIVGVYAGLRPLLRGESEETSRLSREHAVRDRGNGLISVAGGKYTTYRVMARDSGRRGGPVHLVSSRRVVHVRHPSRRSGATSGRKAPQPLRHALRRSQRADRDRPRIRSKGRRRCALLDGRGQVCGHPRGSAAPRRRADQTDPALHRDPRSRSRSCPTHSPDDGRRHRLESGNRRSRARPLRGQGEGRARLPGSTRRQDSRRRPDGSTGCPYRHKRVTKERPLRQWEVPLRRSWSGCSTGSSSHRDPRQPGSTVVSARSSTRRLATKV